jgi:CheY-like chemotaxis protein
VVGRQRGLEALRLAEVLVPDVLLLDMEMPDLKGVEVAQSCVPAALRCNPCAQRL